MSSVLAELFELTDNRFHQTLRSGEGAQPSGQARPTRRSELLERIRTALETAIQTDAEPIKALCDECSLVDRVLLVGECVLTLRALEGRGQVAIDASDLRDSTYSMINELAAAIEEAQSEESGDEELLIHSEALREWAHLFAEHFRSMDDAARFAQMMFVRAKITNAALATWPHLVGDAMVSAGRAIEAYGKMEMAEQFYNGVRLDMGYAVDRIDDPNLPEFELHSALYWFEQACEEYARLHPEDRTAEEQLRRARTVRRERQLREFPAAPRFGPIARTYLDRIAWLALVIEDLQRLDDHSNITMICQRFGCGSSDVEFYISAMGSYFGARPVLEPLGVTMMYDEAHQEVFEAIEHARRS